MGVRFMLMISPRIINVSPGLTESGLTGRLVSGSVPVIGRSPKGEAGAAASSTGAASSLDSSTAASVSLLSSADGSSLASVASSSVVSGAVVPSSSASVASDSVEELLLLSAAALPVGLHRYRHMRPTGIGQLSRKPLLFCSYCVSSSQ